MWSGLERMWVGGVLVVVVLVAVAAAWGVSRTINAQDEDCGGVVAIANGGFESPDLPPGTSRNVTPDGWSGTGTVMTWGEGSQPDNATQYASVFRDATLSQTIHQPELAGSTVTITFAASGEPSALIVRFGSYDQRIMVDSRFVTYALSVPVRADDPGPYILAFEGARPNAVAVDDVAVTFAKLCPTPTPTETPPPSPTREPTNIPTEPPGEQVEITVTGDPRYPVIGSVALDIPGLIYVLSNKPDEGRVVVNTDGSFTYTAASRWVMFDQFAVLASNDTVITVNVVLEIDPPVPSFGEGKPEDTGKDDPGKFMTPLPTLIPVDDEDDTCARCD